MLKEVGEGGVRINLNVSLCIYIVKFPYLPAQRWERPGRLSSTSPGNFFGVENTAKNLIFSNFKW
jgi:hypothetical protein